MNEVREEHNLPKREEVMLTDVTEDKGTEDKMQVETLPEQISTKKGEFFEVDRMKMRESVTEIEGQKGKMEELWDSQEWMIGGADRSISSKEPVPGCVLSSPLSISADIPARFPSISSSDLDLKYHHQGVDILREVPEFSLDFPANLQVDRSQEDVQTPATTGPINVLLQVAYFKRMHKKLSNHSLSYEISESCVVDMSNAPAVLNTQALPATAASSPPGTFQYIHSEEEGNSGKKKTLFRKFVKMSSRFGQTEAYMALLPLARSQIAEQMSSDSNFTQSRSLHWSGSSVNSHRDSLTSLPNLHHLSVRLWPSGCLGILSKLRYPLTILAQNTTLDSCLTLCVILNTIVLSINRYEIDSQQLYALDTCNLIFTIIFAVEMVVKMMGLGLIKYFRSKMNTFDCAIVTLSVLELTLLSGQGVSGVNAIRVFRAFRVLRVARLFRWMTYMRKIMSKIIQSFSKFMYLGLLLLLFMIIFSLLGMQLFGGQFNGDDYDRANYDTFNDAFLATFQILTAENWHNVLHNGMRSRGSVSAIYFIVWLFLGNFVLLNLFLAILLDAFDMDTEEDDDYRSQITSNSSSIENRNNSTKISRKIEIFRKKIEEIQQESIESASNSIDEILVPPAKKELYAGNYCEKSFFVFAKSNWIRVFLSEVVTSTRFEQGIMVVIALSSMKLVWETYLLNEPDGSLKLQISEYLDLAFTIIFCVELVAKTISLGLIFDKGTYLREGWNILDCIIAIFSLIGLTVTSLNISIIKVFRLLRVLRPLRFISHNISMRIIVSALIESMSALIHVTVVMLLVWLIFAILGVSLFAGQFYQCSIVEMETREMCEYYGGEWVNSPYHFDNVIAAMATLFDLTSPENWNDTMYLCMDAVGKEKAMQKNSNPVAAYYIVVFEVVSNFFFLNLFLGVMFDKFEKAKRENTSLTSLILLPEQHRWVEMMKLVIHTKQQPEAVTTRSYFRSFMLKISTHWLFSSFIMFSIIANMIVLGLIYEEASETYMSVLEKFNLAFTGIFTVEAVIKIIGMGGMYFKDRWNLFDFFVVSMSLLDIVMTNTVFESNANRMMTVGPQLARTLRVLRVSRMLRLVKQLQMMDDLIGMLQLSLPAMLNVLTLVALVFVIFGVLGVFLFNSASHGLILDHFNNFDNFGMALIVLIRASTGEDWNYILTDCKAATNVWLAHIFFFSFVCITTFIMYNMFVMVMLQEYENYQNNPDSSFKLFKTHLAVFNAAWNKAARVEKAAKIDHEELYQFAYALDNSLFPEDLTRYEVKKRLGRMGIMPDDNGFVYYHEALFRYIRLIYYPNKIAQGVRRKVIEKEELFYTKKLRKIVKMNKFSGMEKMGKVSGEVKFFDILFLKSVFGSWKKWTKSRQSRSEISITPPMSENYPELNSPIQASDTPVAEQPEEPLYRDIKISRLSTNYSAQK